MANGSDEYIFHLDKINWLPQKAETSHAKMVSALGDDRILFFENFS